MGAEGYHREWTAALARELHDWRRARGMRVSDLAAALGYGSPSTIYHHLRGEAGLDLLDRLAALDPERWSDQRRELLAILERQVTYTGMPPAQAAALREVRAAALALVGVIDRATTGSDSGEGFGGEGIPGGTDGGDGAGCEGAGDLRSSGGKRTRSA